MITDCVSHTAFDGSGTTEHIEIARLACLGSEVHILSTRLQALFLNYYF